MEVETDSRDPNVLLIVEFCPARHLHWVNSAPGTEGHIDPLFLRDISFDNAWVMGKLQGSKPAAIRLAPREPLVREPIECNVCHVVFVSPTEHAVTWVQHYGAALQQAVGKVGFTCYDCMRMSLGEVLCPPVLFK